MATKEITVKSVPHHVAVTGPLPFYTVISAAAFHRRAMEQVALPSRVSDNRVPPPIRFDFLIGSGRQTFVTVSGKRVIIFVRIELHEQADLLHAVQAIYPLPFRLRLRECGQKHASQNGYDRDDNEQLDQSES